VRIKDDTFASHLPSHQVSPSVSRLRSSARRLIALSSLTALSLGHTQANGETFKCVDAGGKPTYQANPCPITADETLKVQAPAPPTGARQSSAMPAASNPTTTPKTATGLSRAPKDRIPTEAEFRGPRETWERLALAMRRGDKNAALKELTPAAQLRLASVFDTVDSKSTPFNVEEFGSIRSVMLAGEGLATITLTRKKADGVYAHEVMLIRDADGKWRIDNM
jgi:Domain of unknown function (DUF4124)